MTGGWPDAEFRESVETQLTQFFDDQSPLVASVGPTYTDAVDLARRFVLQGGKRIRPAFAWTGWLGAGGDPDGVDADAVLQVCSALELVQACALVHDDIIDASLTRRGNPTVHVAFRDRHRTAGWAGDSAKFGESIAILLGDLFLCWADDVIHAADLDRATSRRLAPIWSAMRTEVMGGQLLDVTVDAERDESLESALRIDRYKTAAYTVERPLQIGGALADADPDVMQTYQEFGSDIGVAFQLRDDLLGVFGDPEVTGKPSGDDLKEGKRTVLLAVALERADRHSPESAALIRESIGTDMADSDVDAIRAALIELGAVDDVENRITALTENALGVLSRSRVEDDTKQRLEFMAWSATRRVS